MIIHTTTYGTTLRKAIIGAKKRVWISTYVTALNFKKKTDPVHILFILLQRKAGEGLDIRLLIDHPRQNKPNYHAVMFLIRRLKQWRLPFWIAPDETTCHGKVVLIDDNRCFIGSHNLAKSSFRNPLEVSVEIPSKKINAIVQDWFETGFKNPRFEYYPPGEYDISDIYP